MLFSPWQKHFSSVTVFPLQRLSVFFLTPLCHYVCRQYVEQFGALDARSAGCTVTAGGNSLYFILLCVNGSRSDNGGARALIIFLSLQERYCFSPLLLHS